jgi:hypothetical protein
MSDDLLCAILGVSIFVASVVVRYFALRDMCKCCAQILKNNANKSHNKEGVASEVDEYQYCCIWLNFKPGQCRWCNQKSEAEKQDDHALPERVGDGG